MPVAGLLSAVLQMQPSVPGTGSRWTVLLWTKLLPGAQPSPLPYTTKNPIQQGPSPHSKALPSGGCGYLSTERITTSAPAQTSERLQSQSPPPHRYPQTQHTRGCALLFTLPVSRPGSGGRSRSQSPEQQLLSSALCCAAILTPKTLISNGARYKDGKI